MRIYDEGIFLSHLDIEIAKSERYGYPFSVIMVELADSSKGNILLMKSLLEANYRASDLVALFDEKTYVILLNGVNEHGATEFLKRLIRRAVSENGISIKVGVKEFAKEDTRKQIMKNLEQQINKK